MQQEQLSQVAIMVRAHEKWVAAGRPKDDANYFWSKAEEELRQEAGKAVSDQA